ncbi:MAG: hypothetical protein RQ982_04070 [Gammaproteobacteria bacterium]|nr:hypothetical protein [Gammaproteobacteria bacterium]
MTEQGVECVLKARLQAATSCELKGIVFSLTVLEVKQRIVVKTNELMSYCDTVKTRIKPAQITQLHLADAMTEQAIA